MAKQSIDPALLALQIAKKAMPASLSTQAVAKPSLNVQKQQPQAISTNIKPPVAKIGGISSPFWATNINSSPVLWWATPQEIGTRAKELQSLPNAMPATWASDQKKTIKTDELKSILDKMPDNESRKLAIQKLQERWHIIEWLSQTTPTTTQNIAWWLVQSATWLPSLWAKIANPIFWAVDKYIVDPLSRALWVDEAKIQSNTARAEQARSNIIWWLETAGQKLTWWDPESTAFKTAKLVGDIWQTIITPNAPWLTKWAWLLKWAGQLAWQGLAETVKYSAIADQRLPTAKELAYWVGGNVLLWWAIAWIPKVISNIKIADKADDLANKMLTNMNRITKWEQEKFAAQQGKTVWKRLNDKGIISWWEKTIDKVAKGFLESKNKADEWLALIKGNYKNEYLSTMANEAAEFAENTLSPEASKIRALAQKADDIWLTMPESNVIKRFYERNNKFTYGRDITAGEKTVRATNLDNYVRERQMSIADQNWLSNLRELNKDTQWFKYILDKLVKNEDWRLWNNAMWLTDRIIAWEVASNPSAIGLLVWKKIASSNRFRTWVVKILNRLSWHTNEADKILDIWRIMQIQNEKDLNKFLALPLKKNVSTPSIPLNGNRGNQWMVKWTNVANTPKPTLKTPPITVEKWAIGMWTKTPVLPPKPTVAPSVWEVKIEYNPWVTDISSYSLKEYSNLVKQQYPWIHSSDDISRMYNTLVKEWTIKTPKVGVAPAPKWFKWLWKETMEQNVSKVDDLIQEAKKYKSADEFINDHKKLFHTTSESNAQRIDAEWFIEWKSQWIWDRLVDWVFFVDNEMPLSTITRYSKEPSKIIEWFVSRWSKIKEFKTMDNFEDFLLKDKKYLDLENADLSSKRAKEIFIENWIDVVIKPYWKGTEYIVVNPKVLRTKSQLKQIREQANKKPLPSLPKKWK